MAKRSEEEIEQKRAMKKMRGEMWEFVQFFIGHGVAWRSYSKDCISVGQTHFYFDKDGKYTHLVWDDLGCKEDRL